MVKGRELGGYIELDTYSFPMLHESAVALNCGRNCLVYLIHARNIKKIALPYFLCGSVEGVCRSEGVKIRYYHIGMNFCPSELELEKEEWMYVVNYYGQLDNTTLSKLAKKYKRIIIDNAQAYFQMPIEGIDTIYTCRKFFGVADGAFLYTDAVWDEELPRDESHRRMGFLLGRFEKTAAEFYSEYVKNERNFTKEPVKRMSGLTFNLLHGINYDVAEKCRTENFAYLHERFRTLNNKLTLSVPPGAFMYPLYLEKGAEIRKKLVDEKIYIPILWPEVTDICKSEWLESDMAANILPLPVDQRYGRKEMEYMVKEVSMFANL